MSDFNSELNRVLRYGTDDVHTMLSLLRSPEHDRTRWGDEAGDRTFRGVLADALDEQNRSKEAALLRTEGQHVLVDGDGRVRPAKFTDRPILRAARQLVDHTENWSNGQWEMEPPIEWEDASHTSPVDWEGEDTLEDIDPADHHKPYGYGHLRVHHYANDPTASYSHTAHYSELGPHLAGTIADDVNGADYGWNTEPEDGDQRTFDQRSAEFDRLTDELRKAPYEEIDRTHPTEQPQQ